MRVLQVWKVARSLGSVVKTKENEQPKQALQESILVLSLAHASETWIWDLSERFAIHEAEM